MLRFTRSFDEFEPWSGAVDTYNKIEEAGKLDKLESYLEEVFAGSIPSETDINDLLWHESDSVFGALGLLDDDEDYDDDDYYDDCEEDSEGW